MKLPFYLTNVTLLSKILSLFMFFTFPLIGFVLGMNYQKRIDETQRSANLYINPSLPTTISPTVIPNTTLENTKLVAEPLQNGMTRVTNPVAKFEFIIPSRYRVSGDVNSFGISYFGTESKNTIPNDLSNIQFRIEEMNTHTLLEQVTSEYVAMQAAIGNEVNLKEIKTITVDNVTGYTHSCIFNYLPATCIYLPLNKGNIYLDINTCYLDGEQRGYAEEITKIISSLKFTKN